MGDFKTALKLTGGNEGGYSFVKGDIGLETFAGVSRKFWPNWQGWSHIDTIKENYGTTAAIINKYAFKDVVLMSLVDEFYKQNFWDVNKLDQINDQQIANTCFDFGVNSGVGRAAKTLQTCVGAVADGIIGTITLKAVNSANPKTVYDIYNTGRKMFYENLATHPDQKQFLSDWLSRLVPYKS